VLPKEERADSPKRQHRVCLARNNYHEADVNEHLAILCASDTVGVSWNNLTVGETSLKNGLGISSSTSQRY
jgi:hypothetical protein